jgi:hypothetical protein
VARCVDSGTAADPIDPIIRSAQQYVSELYPNGTRQRRHRAREFLLCVGQGAHAKHQFQAGDTVSGDARPVVEPRLETVEFYKIGNLKSGDGRMTKKRPCRLLGAEFHRRFQSTGNATIGDLQPEPTRKGAHAAFRDARWRSS